MNPVSQTLAGLLLIFMFFIFMLGISRFSELFERQEKGDKTLKKTTQKNAKKFYVGVRDDSTQYVWGMNTITIINKETIDKAYNDYHSSKYDRKYYDDKLKEGFGKPGSDCSGMHHYLSGYDTTAQGYYERCDRKGEFDDLPIKNLVLVFKGQYVEEKVKDKYGEETTVKKLKINHTGVYLGNGMVIHMRSSKDNCVYENVNNHNWTHYGFADFIDYTEDFNTKPILTRDLKKSNKGVDVKLLQDKLNTLGFDCGKVDGDFGSKTETAVKEFQAANKLKDDGVVGKKTCKALNMLWRPNYN